MPHYTYLLIGGGMTADAATQGIRAVDPHGMIGLIGSEPVAPYNRPPLSKGLWKGDFLNSIRRATAERGVLMHPGRTARELDPAGKHVTDDTGLVYSSHTSPCRKRGAIRAVSTASTPCRSASWAN